MDALPKRFRKKSVQRQLQAALDAAQELDAVQPDELSVSRMKLVQSRLDVLSRLQARQRFDRVQRLKQELASARAEIESLKGHLASAQAEIERLTTARPRFGSNLDEKLKQLDQQYAEGAA